MTGSILLIDRRLPCTDYCHLLAGKTMLDRYTGENCDYTPALIALDSFNTISEYLSRVHTDKRYGYGLAKRKGYFIEPFNLKTFVPDMYEIDHSKLVRAGGIMKGDYLRSIEERGGYPSEYFQPPTPVCARHFRQMWGCFREESGYKQGEIVTGKQLVAYISLIVLGDFAMYSQIIGHGGHLKYKIMNLLHVELMNHLKFSIGCRYLMYGDIDTFRIRSLDEWKRSFLFEPVKFNWL